LVKCWGYIYKNKRMNRIFTGGLCKIAKTCIFSLIVCFSRVNARWDPHGRTTGGCLRCPYEPLGVEKKCCNILVENYEVGGFEK
jgi:hypothetical protein